MNDSATTPQAQPMEISSGVAALLEEVRSRLQHLESTGEPGAIDLRSLPLTRGEQEQLRTTLGEGEVDARITALGDSRVYETACHGVWWVHHQNANGDTVAEAIEITRVPAILTVQDGDLDHGLSALNHRIDHLLGHIDPARGDQP